LFDRTGIKCLKAPVKTIAFSTPPNMASGFLAAKRSLVALGAHKMFCYVGRSVLNKGIGHSVEKNIYEKEYAVPTKKSVLSNKFGQTLLAEIRNLSRYVFKTR